MVLVKVTPQRGSFRRILFCTGIVVLAMCGVAILIPRYQDAEMTDAIFITAILD